MCQNQSSLFISQKLQLPLGLSILLYLFLQPWSCPSICILPPPNCSQYVTDSSQKTPICQRHGKSQSLHVYVHCTGYLFISMYTQEGKLVRISILQIIMQFYAEYRILRGKKKRKNIDMVDTQGA